MSTHQRLRNSIFDGSIPFKKRCLDLFDFQFQYNQVYRTFSETLGVTPRKISSVDQIPLLPIEAFKRCRIVTNQPSGEPEVYFESSGTSGMDRSQHVVLNQSVYKESVLSGFDTHFPVNQTALAFYMPGYRQNRHSSLIKMAEILIENDPSGLSRFIQTSDDLCKMIENVNQYGKKLVLFGAAFGLLDMIEQWDIPDTNNIEVIETGGMKTYRREISKRELRIRISDGFNIPQKSIHSEYGMCELLSQMYAIGSEWFSHPHWINVTIRNSDNPMIEEGYGEEGKIGIIDLANLYSCPFILTEDRGVMNAEGQFQVLGRWNTESLRGCNFLIDDE